MNRFTITGNLGADVKVKEFTRNNGDAYEAIYVKICNNRYAGKNQDGTPRYEDNWFDVAVFDKRYHGLLKKYGVKGAKFMLEGVISTETVKHEGRYFDTATFRIGGMDNGTVEMLQASANERSSEPKPQEQREYERDTLSDDIPF